MDHRELAAELFLSDCNCAQAVLEAVSYTHLTLPTILLV